MAMPPASDHAAVPMPPASGAAEHAQPQPYITAMSASSIPGEAAAVSDMPDMARDKSWEHAAAPMPPASDHIAMVPPPCPPPPNTSGMFEDLDGAPSSEGPAAPMPPASDPTAAPMPPASDHAAAPMPPASVHAAEHAQPQPCITAMSASSIPGEPAVVSDMPGMARAPTDPEGGRDVVDVEENPWERLADPEDYHPQPTLPAPNAHLGTPQHIPQAHDQNRSLGQVIPRGIAQPAAESGILLLTDESGMALPTDESMALPTDESGMALPTALPTDGSWEHASQFEE